MKKENYINANGTILCCDCSQRYDKAGQTETITDQEEAIHCECCWETIGWEGG